MSWGSWWITAISDGDPPPSLAHSPSEPSSSSNHESSPSRSSWKSSSSSCVIASASGSCPLGRASIMSPGSACSTPDARSRSMVRGSADFTTVTTQPGQRNEYVPLPSGAVILTDTSAEVNSTSPQSGQEALIVAISSHPFDEYSALELKGLVFSGYGCCPCKGEEETRTDRSRCYHVLLAVRASCEYRCTKNEDFSCRNKEIVRALTARDFSFQTPTPCLVLPGAIAPNTVKIIKLNAILVKSFV